MPKHRAVLLLAIMALSGCWNSQYTADYNQKVVLHIDTPNGTIQADTVLRLVKTRYRRPLFATDTIWQVKFAGESLAVRLGDRWLTMALNPSRFAAAYDTIVTPDVRHVSDARRRLFLEARHRLKAIQSSVGQTFDLPPGNYPDLVGFSDIRDPATVFEVDPDDLAATFGEGYALEKVTLMVTEEPITEGVIETLLPWLPEHGGRIRIPGRPQLGYLLYQGPKPRSW